MNNRKVTIQDIADELGISRNTVSKAINNAEGIADSTILLKSGYKALTREEVVEILRQSL